MALFAIREAVIPAAPTGLRDRITQTIWNGRSWSADAECFGRATDFLFGRGRQDIRFLANHPDSTGLSKVYKITTDPARLYKFTLVSE
jgi:hypothetical protein